MTPRTPTAAGYETPVLTALGTLRDLTAQERFYEITPAEMTKKKPGNGYHTSHPSHTSGFSGATTAT